MTDGSAAQRNAPIVTHSVEKTTRSTAAGMAAPIVRRYSARSAVDRIDAGGAPRGQIGRDKRRREQHDDHRRERQRIVRLEPLVSPTSRRVAATPPTMPSTVPSSARRMP